MDLIVADDMSPEEKESLQNYVDNGCPGLTKATEVQIFKWFELYMAGKSYEEIAVITKSKKDLILFISNKSKWCDKRMAHYSDLALNLSNKLAQVKMNSANTVASAIMALSKYYGDKFNDYLSTKDNALIENMDTKMLAQYYKAMEALDKIVGGGSGKSSDDDNGRKPLVNFNIGAKATIKENEDGSVEVTDETVGEALGLLAKLKRQAESDES